jgi:hypothetical protein
MHAEKVNADVEALIPMLEKYLEEGKLKPMECEVIGKVGDGGDLDCA